MCFFHIERIWNVSTTKQLFSNFISSSDNGGDDDITGDDGMKTGNKCVPGPGGNPGGCPINMATTAGSDGCM